MGFGLSSYRIKEGTANVPAKFQNVVVEKNEDEIGGQDEQSGYNKKDKRETWGQSNQKTS